MTQHTPGPLAPSKSIAKTIDGLGRATVTLERGGEYCVEINAPADVVDEWARLTAAAPELLKAAKHALRHIDPDHTDAKRLRAAIAKAEGSTS